MIPGMAEQTTHLFSDVAMVMGTLFKEIIERSKDENLAWVCLGGYQIPAFQDCHVILLEFEEFV